MDLHITLRSVVVLNTRSFVNKIQLGEFELLLHSKMFNIIAVWLKPYIPNNLIDGNDKYYDNRKDRYQF